MTAWYSIPDAELGEHVAHMRLDRGFAHVEQSGDVGVAVSGRQLSKDVELPLGEAGELSHEQGVRLGGRGECLDHPSCHGRSEAAVSGGDDSDGLDQLLGCRVLEQKTRGAGAQGSEDVLVEVERGEHDGPGRQPGRGDEPGGGDAVHARHPNVHECHVRAVLPDRRDRLLSVASLGDDADVMVLLEQGPDPGSDHRLIIGDDDVDHHAPVLGSWALTMNPPPC